MLFKIQDFFRSEPAAGIVLMVAAVLGILAANVSGSAAYYFTALETKIFGMTLLHWINDGLMAIFFLYVGLEVKREWLVGELSDNSKRLLPAVAALGGLLLPALIYLLFSGTNTPATSGWAIPAATDIAFALGVLALLGNRVPLSLKVFLTALAIMDDLMAIVIIAVFYTEQIKWLYAVPAILTAIALFYLNFKRIYRTKPYLLLGLLLWFLVLKTGVHATLAGVMLAFAIPLRHQDHAYEPLLLQWEHALTNWVAFLVIPIFGFANAGVSFADFGWEMALSSVVWGVALGLFVGKQVGVLGAVWLMMKLKLAHLPEGANFKQLYGVALLCGIGFTMSLFIGLLAFDDVMLQNQAKLGVFLGSFLSGVMGFWVLKKSATKTESL